MKSENIATFKEWIPKISRFSRKAFRNYLNLFGKYSERLYNNSANKKILSHIINEDSISGI